MSNPNQTVAITIDHAAGGRLSSLVVHGHELLVGRVDDPLNWGWYPMVPFAGRVRSGLLRFEDTSTQLPPYIGGHAIHGYGFVSPWDVVGENEIRFDFDDPWPWRGSATQVFTLTDQSLTISMRVDAIDRQPVQVGWHPWFRRDIGNGCAAELDFAPDFKFERDETGLPSGERVDPGRGPWDDCFGDLASNPVLRWGDLSLELSSTATEWTVYDEPAHALCVEPQTGPPNQVNDAPHILDGGESMTELFTLTWSRS